MGKRFGMRQILLGTVFLAAATCSSEAVVEISSKATQNMSCKGGVCAPTAANAVLSAKDLENMLASGNVTVTTTGSKVQASNIDIDTAVSWSSSNTLSLDAYVSIVVNNPVSVNGRSGLSLVTDDGGKNGTLWFSSKGHIAFKSLASQLSINGASYTLAGDVKTLASDIAGNASGKFALANSYNAKADGTYSSPPLPGLSGVVNGLGNTISNLSISDSTTSDDVGLFVQIYSGGTAGSGATVASLKLANVAIAGPSGTSSSYSFIGAFVGINNGILFNDSVTGQVEGGEYGFVGGLIGLNSTYEQAIAEIENCSSAATVTGGTDSIDGGLVGGQDGSVISQSYASGAVSVGSGNAGGIAGNNLNGSSVTDSYATGDTTAATNAAVGGLIGYNGALVYYSYSTGSPSGSASCVGGLIGCDVSSSGSLKDNYWDTTTSGITDLSRGAGNVSNDPGIKGLSNKQLQSKLPKGFSKKVWKESGKLNGGLPYLIANPSAK